MLKEKDGKYYIKNLDDFYQAIRKITQSKNGDYVFRGQESDLWDVDSSATRRLVEDNKHLGVDRIVSMFDVINYQKTSLVDPIKLEGWHFRDGHELCDLEILTELQHFGAATMLIDFTTDPFIALWFACAPSSEPSDSGVVFLCDIGDMDNFNAVTIDILEKTLDKIYKEEIEKESKEPQKMFHYRPSRLNQRISSQRSIFIFGKPVIPKEMLNMVVIKAENKETIRQELKTTHGLSEIKIYDDFYGFAKANNCKAKIDVLKAENYLKLGNEISQNGDYENAIKYYDKAINSRHDYAEAYNNRGNAKLEKRDLDGAIKDYDKAVELKPDYAEAYNNRGNVESDKGDHNSAIKNYDKAIELRPDYAIAYYNRGTEKTDKGDLDEAIEDFNKSIEKKPGYAEAYGNRGIAKLKKGDFDNAIKDFNKAIELKPNYYAELYNNRGLAKLEKRDLDGAIKDYDKAVELKPDYAEAYHGRGITKADKGDLDGAIDDYNKVVQLKPDYAEAYYNRGVAKYMKVDLEGAIKDYDEAIKLNSGDAEAYHNLGMALSKLGKKDEARKSFETALKLAKEQNDDELINNIQNEIGKLEKDDIT